MVPFGPWLPDIAAFNSLAATEALNVIPSQTGFRPFPGFSALTSAVGARVQGAVSVRDLSGNTHNFCGTATKLYKMHSDGLSWDDVTRTVGGAYAVPTDGWWEFSIFGDVLMADNGTDAAQSFTLSSSTNFAALAGTPPIATFGATVKGFAVKARVAGAFNRVHWSAIENSADWVASATTLSDAQDLPDGGVVMGIASTGEYALIFQERAIQRMSFEGPPTAFRFDKISTSLGVRCERSIAAYDNIAFFLSNDGFYMIRGGVELTAIGDDKLDRWFETNFDGTYPYRVSSAIDPVRKLYVMGFPSSSASMGTPDSLVIYHWPTGQWARASVTHEIIYSASTQSGYTIDGLDSVWSSIDAGTFPVDSRVYTGSGRLLLSGFNTSHCQGYFSGTNLAPTVETGDAQLSPGRKTLLRGLRVIVEGSSATPTAVIRYRDRLQDSLTSATGVAAISTGMCPVRVNARYHRAQITIPAGDTWNFLTGIDDLRFSAMGTR